MPFIKKARKTKTMSMVIVFIGILGLWSTSYGKTLKIATLSPDGSYWMKKLREAGVQVEQETKGRVKFKFYPGGVMGDDKAVMRKMRIGQLHGGAFTANAIVPYYRDIQAYNLMDAFKNYREVDFVRDKLDEKMLSGLNQGGITALGIAEIGFAYIMSTQAIKSIEDVRRSKAWVPDNDSNALEAIRAFGIAPVPLPFGDVLLGLQTGMIETVGASPMAAIALQWHTQIKYIIDIPLLYIYGVFALDQKTFSRLKPEDQETVSKVFSKALSEIDQQNRIDDKKAFEALIDAGVELVKPANPEREEFSRLSEQANLNQIKKSNVSQAMYEEFYHHLGESRRLKAD